MKFGPKFTLIAVAARAQRACVPIDLSSKLAEGALHAPTVVIRPLGRITAAVNDLANGNTEVPGLPAAVH